MSIRARAWHRSNTFTHGQFTPARIAAERRTTVSICLPARNEERTIGAIIAGGVERPPLAKLRAAA